MSQKPKSILLVDDDRDIIELMQESLEDLSFKVYTAFNGQEALDFMARNKVDCIVTDISMPLLDGQEFIRRLKEGGDQTPFFFITGYQDYSREDLNNYKPRAIIFKPFDFEEAAILIKNHVMRA
jgi:CheY-like chemotaxis protein